MSEIEELEEIKKFLKDYEEENSMGGMPLMAEEIYIKHVRCLFSSLEGTQKEKDDFKELFKVEQEACHSLESSLEKKREKAEKLQQRLDLEKVSYNGMEQLLIREREKVKELEAKIAIYLQDIKHEQSLSTELNDRLQKLVGSIRQLIKSYKNQISYSFQKELEEVLEVKGEKLDPVIDPNSGAYGDV